MSRSGKGGVAANWSQARQRDKTIERMREATEGNVDDQQGHSNKNLRRIYIPQDCLDW